MSRHIAAAGDEGLNVGQDGGGLGQGVKTQLNERRVFNCGFNTGDELGGGAPLDRDTQLSDAQPGQNRRWGSRMVVRVGDGKRHSLQLTHIKGVSMLMQPGMCRFGRYFSTDSAAAADPGGCGGRFRGGRRAAEIERFD